MLSPYTNPLDGAHILRCRKASLGKGFMYSDCHCRIGTFSEKGSGNTGFPFSSQSITTYCGRWKFHLVD